MKKILIALESENMAQQLQQQLSRLFCVLVCHNGLDAAEILQEQRPDVLVLDLMLPELDGVTLLHMARDGGIHPKVIALAFCMADHVAAALEQLGVSCLLRYDCRLTYMTARILELAQQCEQNEEPLWKTRRILAQLGFKMNTVGCRITEAAVCSYRETPFCQITTQLYPKVAQLTGGTASQVEKAIRSSVESAWKNRDEQVWRIYFSSGKSGKITKPSNADFLARIALCIMDEEYGREKAM